MTERCPCYVADMEGDCEYCGVDEAGHDVRAVDGPHLDPHPADTTPAAAVIVDEPAAEAEPSLVAWVRAGSE